MNLSIIIVNYRTAALTIECLRSVLEGGIALRPRILVVENASGDDSLARIQSAVNANRWGSAVTILAADENRGFAAGNNLALRHLLHGPVPAPDFILLLNPDTIVRAGAIDTLLKFMESHPKVGIAGSRLEDPDGTPQTSAFRFPSLAGEFEDGAHVGPITCVLARWRIAPPQQRATHKTDWVAGASMMIRTDVFRDVGLLDERFFMYYEEVDFCRRAARKGWECWHVPEARVVHLVGQSSGITGKHATRPLPAYWFAARRHYFVKAYGRLYALAAESSYLAGHVLSRVRFLCSRRAPDTPPNRFRDGIHLIIGKTPARNP